ncbi:class I SAM-dependent methyltransferase [Phenylobacterium sp.]|uniref:class I SAM-dependent methyltransferase n=1 Tax=Phenylobacterium sp. TaxID=1871053 RepID=UPI002C351817|nr:class I SAM-dependent methyltransferase [Phenylobacterium sp.]HVI32341.1 class I SAM-dependent methyltransferase [Phenylobacterium sp.]
MSETNPDAPAPPRKPLKGPPYRDFVRYVTLVTRARRYMEVGVRNGFTLGKVDCASVGVDPKFVFDRDVMGNKPSLHLYQMTSDDYFRDHDPRAVLGGPVDVAFLDGMHLFEFLLRDFMNTERVCHPGSVILLDDCLPVNIEMTEREHRPELRADRQIAGWWTGDVWKVVSILRAYRPELRIAAFDVIPTGSIAVSGLDPHSTVLADAYDEILARYGPEDLTPERFDAYWEENRPAPTGAFVGMFDLPI